jgi:predicted Zn-dependent protease
MKRIACIPVLLVLLMQACSTNPTTGRSQFTVLSRDQEIALGAEAAPQLTQEMGGSVRNPELQAYVTNIGRQLAAVTEADNPSLPWEFTLLDSEVINAFALPGGKVFISRGLTQRMTNEAQLAAVLGHEVGHVTARHSNERMGQSSILGAIGSIGGGLLGGNAGAQAGQSIAGVAAMSYSRDQEIEADRLGMRYMEKLKYNPVGAVQVQEILAEASEGSEQPPEFLSTHPASERRIAELNKRLDKYYQHTIDNPEFSFHEERFRTQFLRKLSMTPMSQEAIVAARRMHAGERSRLMLMTLGDPTQWCAHCRDAADHADSQHRQ